MNDLAITTSTKFKNMTTLMKRNRETYPKAYFERKSEYLFDLGSFIIEYCLDEFSGSEWGNWEDDYVNNQTVLIPMKSYKDDSLGFFGMPPKVQEGILIFIQESLFYAEKSYGEDDFYYISADLYYSGQDIITHYIKQSEEYSKLSTNDEREALVENEVFGWNEWQSYNGYMGGPGEQFFPIEDAVIFFSQLAAYMGYTVKLDSSFYDESGFSPADLLLDAMATWEGKKGGVEFAVSGSNHYHTETVIVVNSEQGILTGNTDLADYMEDIFNRTPWQYELKDLIDKYPEFFPLRDTKIRIDAYAEMERG